MWKKIKRLNSFDQIKEDGKGKDIEIIITVSNILRVLDLKDEDGDPVGLSERLCKGLWFRMGYMGFINDSHYNKQNLSFPYKFLMHSVIHAMGHRKGGYNISLDYIMCMVTALILNRPYNISQVEHMKANVADEKFLQYPRFIQMILDDKIKNLEKNEKDELILDHMTNATLERLQVYKKKKAPLTRRKFASIEKPDYIPPLNNKWCHDESDSGNKDEKMELFESKRSKSFIKDEEKKKKSRSGTPKKKPIQRQLIDEPSDDEVQNADENVEMGDAGISGVNTTQEIEDLAFGATKNVEENV
ncbi:hypothetical protein HanLR1_Chr05g0172281 [Helianthus annuus]|nr:hypothetical protein HanLR1_Chr05g0172281 [Helianthus annuus]